jgi:hypothetical protein
MGTIMVLDCAQVAYWRGCSAQFLKAMVVNRCILNV